MAEDKAVSFKNVGKTFGTKRVLIDVSFELPRGELLILLGPNGAGKSTAMSLITGLGRPSWGAVEIFGHAAGSLNSKRRFAYVPQECSFPQHATTRQVLKFMGAHSTSPRPIETLMEGLSVAPFLDTAVRHLSGGQKRLLAIAGAFMRPIDLVILDEPTAGLDLETRRQVFQYLGDYIKSGGTVLMTTHYLAETEALATRVVVLNQGRIVRSGAPDDIRRRLGFKRISFRSITVPPFADIHADGDRRWIDSRTPDATLRMVVEWGQAEDVEVTPISLEEIFDQAVMSEGLWS